MSILASAKILGMPLVHPGDAALSFDAMADQLEREWEQMPENERPVAILIDMTGAGYGLWQALTANESTLPFVGVMFTLPDMANNKQVIRLQSRSCGVRSSTPAGIGYAPRRCDSECVT